MVISGVGGVGEGDMCNDIVHIHIHMLFGNLKFTVNVSFSVSGLTFAGVLHSTADFLLRSQHFVLLRFHPKRLDCIGFHVFSLFAPQKCPQHSVEDRRNKTEEMCRLCPRIRIDSILWWSQVHPFALSASSRALFIERCWMSNWGILVMTSSHWIWLRCDMKAS